MKVMQLLPALNSGGVERGTLDLARMLALAGHESIVVSCGGSLVPRLESEGSRHFTLPIHKKSLSSLLQVRPLRQLIQQESPDVLHVRSRVPAWLTFLAWRKLAANSRPRLISTAHGLYSVNRYSAIMASSEQVIAISECVNNYLQSNYEAYLQRPPEIIYRGVDTDEFNPNIPLPTGWRESIEQEFPNLRGKRWLLLPGRLTRWKGQEDFIDLIQRLSFNHSDIHGIILGGAEPNKSHYEEELKRQVKEKGVESHLTFVGHRSDIRHWYKESSLVYNLSKRPEPFGRTVIESVAMETPVIGYNVGGPAESLRICFPQGLVEQDDTEGLYNRTQVLLSDPKQKVSLSEDFTLRRQAEHTIEVYKAMIKESSQAYDRD